MFSSSDESGVVSTQLAHSNTPSRSQNHKYHLYHLLEKGATTKLTRPGNVANNDCLFYEGDRFDPEIFNRSFTNDYSFNDGEEISYIIDIKDISNNQATIKFIEI